MIISKRPDIRYSVFGVKSGNDHASGVYRIGEFVNCIQCEGVTTRCKYCGRKVNFLNGKCMDDGAGTLHRCGYGRF